MSAERQTESEALRAHLEAVSAACDLAEEEARHVVDDEVYVSVGLIRNALNGITDHCDCAELCAMGPTCPGASPDLPGAGCWRVSSSPAASEGGAS